MVITRKAADSPGKSGVVSLVTGFFSGSRQRTLESLDSSKANLDQLSTRALRDLVKSCPGDEDILVHYARQASREAEADDVLAAVTANPEVILCRCPEVAAQYLVIFRGSHEVFSPDQLFRLGQWCESSNKPSYALSIYEQWELAYFHIPELEAVSYKAASLWWFEMANSKRALQKLEIIFKKFPQGQYASQAAELRDEILQSSSKPSKLAA